MVTHPSRQRRRSTPAPSPPPRTSRTLSRSSAALLVGWSKSNSPNPVVALSREPPLHTPSVRHDSESVEEPVDPLYPVRRLLLITVFCQGASVSSAGAASTAVPMVIALKKEEEKDENLILLFILARAPDRIGRFFL